MPDVILTFGSDQSSISKLISQVNNQLARGINANPFIQPLGRITGKANEFQKSLEASNARVIAFGASAGSIYALRTAFNKLVSSTVDVEKSLTEINALLNLSNKDLSRFSSGLFRAANETGTSFRDAAKAAQELARQGLGVEATLQRTRSALTLTRLSGLSLEESVASITATLNGFRKEALTDIEVVNRLANVDAKFAVSSSDLAEALKRVSSSASDAGVSFNEVIALVTAAQQATARGGSVIGNSLKTIFTRLQRPQVLQDLETAGVSVRDLQGNVLPLVQVLGNLSNTYDGLSSSQKSFVAETVGGVYQINILKSILGDLGSGFSIFQGALNAATDSTSAAQDRLSKLNTTISTQLIQTLNDLTKASAGVGNLAFGPSIKGGLKALDGLINTIGGAASSENEGLGASLFKGFAKGLGNVLSGPGIQLAVFGIVKLFQRLQGFVIDSFKDLSGINDKVKERTSVEQVVVKYLQQEKTLIHDLLSGQTSLADVHNRILHTIKQEADILKVVSTYTPAIANALQASGVRIGKNPLTKAEGYVPNLNIAYDETMGAKSGGYQAGNILSTSVRDGISSIPVVANSNETKSSVTIGGKVYEFINPPSGSIAGIKHANRSKRKVGINPYDLLQSPMSGGFVPNLNIPTVRSDALLQVAKQVLDGNNIGDGGIFEDIYTSKIRPPLYNLSESKKVILGIFRSLKFGRKYVDEGGRATPQGNRLAESIVNAFGRADKLASKTKSGDIAPSDIQKMLSLRGQEFAALVAFSDFSTKTPSGSGATIGETEIDGVKYKVPFRFGGLKNPQALYEVFRKSTISTTQGLKEALGGGLGKIDISNEGQTFGNLFDSAIKSIAEDLGVKTGKGNENLDILGYDPRLAEKFSPLKPFAGADIKTSLGIDTSNQVATKIARVLALKKGAGLAEIPPFKNIGQFTGKNAGFLDYDYFTGGRNEFESLVYAALSTGKPVKVNIGPPGSGKTTDALKTGGKSIGSHTDLEKFAEYIIVTSARTNLGSGVLGLALASASNVTGFNLSKGQILDNIKKRASGPVPLGDTRGQTGLSSILTAIEADPSKLDYSSVFKELKERFGGLNRFKFAYSGGFVPNLNYSKAIKNALYRENSATGGNAMLDSDSSLISSDNPFGLAAIDRENQGSASNAIKQHRKLGQSLSNIRSSKSSGGYVPNLAIDSNQILISTLLATFQNLSGTSDILPKKVKDLIEPVMNTFRDSITKTIIKQKEWIASIEQAKQKLLLDPSKKVSVPTSPGSQRNFRFANITDLEARLDTRVQKASRSIQSYDDALTSQRSRIQRAGFLTSIGGGIAGGAVSQFAGKFSPDLSVGIDQFTSGLVTGGQVLTVFQGKFGKVAAGFAILDGLLSGLDTYFKGVEQAKKQFEIQQTQTQKLVTSFNELSQTLSSLDNLYLDSSVSLETLTKEQRKYEEILSRVSNLSPEIANRIQTAPDSKSKISELTRARDLENKKLELSAGRLEVKELASERSFNVLGFQSSALSGGIFGFKTPSEQDRSLRVIQNNAFNVISDLSDTLKKELIGVVGNSPQFESKLNQSNAFKQLVDEIKGSGGTTNDVKLIVEQLRVLLGNEAINKSPDVLNARKLAISANERAQFAVDNAVRNESAFKRLFINLGSLQGGNILDIRKTGSRETGRQFAVQEAGEKAKGGLINFLFGEETGQLRELGLEAKQIGESRRQKTEDLTDKSSRGLLDILTQNLDKFLTPTFSPGLGSNPINVSDRNKDILSALNTGVSQAVKSGDLTQFIKNGPAGFEDLQKAIVSNSGANPNIQKELTSFLSNNAGSLEILKLIEQNNNELVDINQDSLKELQILGQKSDAIRKELDIRRQSNFLGGTNLFDRAFRRTQSREFARAEARASRGATAESKGEGAFNVLRLIASKGGKLEFSFDQLLQKFLPTTNTKESKQQTQFANIALEGLASLQTKSANRIGDRNKGSLAQEIVSAFLSSGLGNKDASGFAIQSVLKPESTNLINDNLGELASSTTIMNAAFLEAKKQVDLFGNSLQGIREKLEGAAKSREQIQKEAQNVKNKGTGVISESISRTSSGLGVSTSSDTIKNLLNKSSNLSPLVNTGLNIAGGLGALALYKSKGVRSAVGKVLSKTGGQIGRFGAASGGALAESAGLLFGGAGEALAAAPLLTGAAVAGTAYGGFKLGQGAYRLGHKELFNEVNEGTSESVKSAYKVVQSDLKAGKSTNSIQTFIDAQIKSTQEQLKTAGGGGFFSNIIGIGKEAGGLKEAIEQLKQLRESIAGAKDEFQSQQEGKDTQNKLVTALERLANGQSNDSNIKVEISLKDIDKLPDIFNSRVIKPLEIQLKSLQGRTTDIEQSVGIGPKPPGV